MGITGGVALCASASASETNSINPNQLLAAGCGGPKGCGSIAYQPHGCSTPMQGQPQMQGQSQSGCNSMPQDRNFTAYQSHGCNTAQPQSYYNNAPQGEYSSPQAPQSGYNTQDDARGMEQPQTYNSRNNSQWNTNGKVANTVAPVKASDDAQILSQLNDEGKSIYRGLDPAGKAMADKLINQSCKGKNDCKGLNSCKTAENSCAGKGSCQGKSPGPFKDKNQAVKIVAQKMSEKRVNAAAPRA